MVREIKIRRSDWNQFLEDLPELLGENLITGLKRRVAVDTARLKNSIELRQVGKDYFIVMAEHGRYVEWGTPPHIIRPKTAKALKFEVDKKERLARKGKRSEANIVFAKEVQHPGTMPQPFIRPTLRGDIPRILERLLMRAAQ